MPDTLDVRHGLRIWQCSTDGPVLAGERDATDLVGQALSEQADWVVVPVSRLDPGFFTLGTGLAGAIFQKLGNYRLRLAIVGDICGPIERSDALRDLVYECNRGRQVWFAPDAADLDDRLSRQRSG